MSEENKLTEVNATLDRFAKLIEENDRRSAKNREEDREEAKRLRAEDLARELAKDAKRQAEEEKRKAEDAKRQAEWNERQAEWDERQAEWDKRQAQWDKRFDNMCDQIGGQGSTIGDITEAMTVSDNIIDLVNEFEGINVTNFAFNIRKKYRRNDSNGNRIRRQHEVDGLADGKKVAVVIEAKTTLTEEYVKRFITKLAKFRIAYPEHAHKDIYGAVTFIRVKEQGALDLAEQHGLFILKTSPPDVKLVNSKGFIPTKIV